MLNYFTAGESHGEALVAFLSGLPAGLKIDQAFLDRELWRRQQGYGRIHSVGAMADARRAAGWEGPDANP